ncbi:hypothetical protein IRJ41_001386 [Triplophysa rosa]|uniref:Uncharacterized protein n=1 Tax=Triplophysa rosa TaxID=992332 RepID=A0A9W7X395_TRIRA|nr:hypothetical protein IRJ41_001386 [Triplophysa rosa]
MAREALGSKRPGNHGRLHDDCASTAEKEIYSVCGCVRVIEYIAYSLALLLFPVPLSRVRREPGPHVPLSDNCWILESLMAPERSTGNASSDSL